MFNRSRLAGVAAAAGAALALLAGSATASAATVATAASAAKPAKAAKAANPFALTLQHVQTGRLMPGGRTRSFEFSVTNRSSKPQTLSAEIEGTAHGIFPLGSPNRTIADGYPLAVTEKVQKVRGQAFTLAPVSHGRGWAEYIQSAVSGSDCCYTLPLVLPAHATYTWKLTYGAAKTWPRNDDRLNVGVKVWAGSSAPVTRTVSYQVGTARTAGPVLQKLTGPSALHNGRPAVFDYALTNRTGAPLKLGKYYLHLDVWGVVGLISSPSLVSFQLDLWDGHRWVPQNLGVDTDWAFLRTTGVTIANGATLHTRFRITVKGSPIGTPQLVTSYLEDDQLAGAYVTKTLAYSNH